MLEHGRFLELPADSHLRDLRFAHRKQIGRLSEPCRARVRTRLARDHVHHRRLTGTVRPDDAAKLTHVDVERKCVQCLEAVEADGNVFEVQDRTVRRIARGGTRLARAGAEHFLPAVSNGGCCIHAGTALVRTLGLRANRLPNPTTPCGKKSVTNTNIAPRAYSQNSGSAAVKNVFA